jgi:hypothetical protein
MTEEWGANASTDLDVQNGIVGVRNIAAGSSSEI